MNGEAVVPLAFTGNYTGTITVSIQTKDRQQINITDSAGKTRVSINFSVSYTLSKTPKDLFFSKDGKVLSVNTGVTPITLSYVQAIAELKPPVFIPTPGTYNDFISVTIQNKVQEAQTYYTIDSSTPGPSTGTLYTDPVKVTDACVIKAMSVCKGYKNSDVTSGTYDYYFGTLQTPVISPGTGTYQSPRTITLSCSDPEAEIF